MRRFVGMVSALPIRQFRRRLQHRARQELHAVYGELSIFAKCDSLWTVTRGAVLGLGLGPQADGLRLSGRVHAQLRCL